MTTTQTPTSDRFTDHHTDAEIPVLLRVPDVQPGHAARREPAPPPSQQATATLEPVSDELAEQESVPATAPPTQSLTADRRQRRPFDTPTPWWRVWAVRAVILSVMGVILMTAWWLINGRPGEQPAPLDEPPLWEGQDAATVGGPAVDWEDWSGDETKRQAADKQDHESLLPKTADLRDGATSDQLAPTHHARLGHPQLNDRPTDNHRSATGEQPHYAAPRAAINTSLQEPVGQNPGEQSSDFQTPRLEDPQRSDSNPQGRPTLQDNSSNLGPMHVGRPAYPETHPANWRWQPVADSGHRSDAARTSMLPNHRQNPSPAGGAFSPEPGVARLQGTIDPVPPRTDNERTRPSLY